MSPMGEPCPVCRRVGGGHDQTVHDMADMGAKTPPTK